jgi:hypothetical protein
MSAASYQKVDYRLRPAKHIERKMIADAVRRLDRVSALSLYRYIGFGSPFFSDFSLFHKALDIAEMVSIERMVEDKPRFEFNRPFDCVALEFGESGDILPDLDWSVRSIVWLDYDKKLSSGPLADVETVIANAASPSVILVTVNADPGAYPDRAKKLRDRLPGLVPIDATDDTLGGWGMAEVYRSIIDERIQITLRNRNHGMSAGAVVVYEQLFNFHYQDGMPMLTVGGVVFDEGLRAQIDHCSFGDFDFTRDGTESCDISVPNVTPKEMRRLNEALPSATPSEISQAGLTAADIETYARVYRYFPTYVDAEL